MDIVIVGGGLVGGLAACALAKRGHRIRVYEYRPDIRVEETRGQSIDLALSIRGREALKLVDLEDTIVNNHGIAMRGRMIHGKDGTLKEMIYDPVKNNCLYSVSRNYLNQILLDAADKFPSVTLMFNHKLLECDLDSGTLKFFNMKTNEIIETSAEFIVGADGAHSTVRKMMMKQPGFDFSQTYIKHGYVELNIPARMIDEKHPEKGYEFCISPKHFHIWPRGTFMMIAMPNSDFTFTGNLFAPLEILHGLNTPEKLINLYKEQFPDVIPLLGDQKILVDNFFSTKPKPLISIKANPHHASKSLILGDAAHAMVPFYGQGMNVAFEDVLILNELMDLYDEDMSKVLPAFSEKRIEDAHAICDLAMYNYIEMRELVLKKSFIIRRIFDTFLHKLWPNGWLPLYFTVIFTRMGFRDCIVNRSWQDKILQRSFWFLAAVVTIGVLIISIFIGRTP